MSDYLWDKTGEPEDDVAQLENLLGTLKYRPRPLDIPATAMPTAPAAATTATRPAITTIFSRPRLALAASLLLTLLAGVWLITRQGEPRQEQVADIKQGSTAGEGAQPDKAMAPNTQTDKQAPADGRERAVAREDTREDKRIAVAAAAAVSTTKPRRASRSKVARRHKLAPRGLENAPAPREEVAVGRSALRWQAEQPLTPRQREATEQLMLALRLASAKLNYAQREMLEIGRAGK